MKRHLTVLLAAVGLLAGPASAGDSYVLIRNATLIDGTGAAPRPGASLLIHGERIERLWFGQAMAFKLPGDAEVVDATGLFLLPGLVNTHEHLATPPNRRFAEAQMRRDLYGGVTVVRDMADDLRQVADLARAAQVGEIPGPDIHYAALMAGPEFFKDPRTHAVTAGATPGRTPWMRAVDATTDLAEAVTLARGTGAAAIKIYADLPAERVAAITAEAHRQGLPTWTHAAVFPARPSEVLAAGTDVVSHVCMLAYEVSDPVPSAYHDRAPIDLARLGQGDNPAIGALLSAMKAKGTILDATLTVYENLDARAAARPDAPKPYCDGASAYRLTAQARRAGVAVSAGTDAFSAPDDPYPALYRELELMVDKAGFTPLQALTAATSVGAAAVRKDADFGVVSEGKLANLMLTAKDPSKDIAALRTVTMTVKRGVLYRRADYRPDPAALKED